MRAGLFLHPAVQRDVAVTGERRLRIARHRNRSYPEPLQMVEESEDLVGLTALRDEDRDIGFTNDAEISVDAVCGVKKGCRSTSGRQCSGDLAADEARFADTGHDNTSLGAGNALDGAREIFTDAALGLAERLGLHAENTSSALDDVLVGHRLMRAQMSTARLINGPISDSGSMFGPSLGALSGSG